MAKQTTHNIPQIQLSQLKSLEMLDPESARVLQQDIDHLAKSMQSAFEQFVEDSRAETVQLREELATALAASGSGDLEKVIGDAKTARERRVGAYKHVDTVLQRLEGKAFIPTYHIEKPTLIASVVLGVAAVAGASGIGTRAYLKRATQKRVEALGAGETLKIGDVEFTRLDQTQE